MIAESPLLGVPKQSYPSFPKSRTGKVPVSKLASVLDGESLALPVTPVPDNKDDIAKYRK